MLCVVRTLSGPPSQPTAFVPAVDRALAASSPDATLPEFARVGGVDRASQLSSTTHVLVWSFDDYHPFEVPPSTFNPPSGCSCA